mmetsp:Transcript_16827/g.43944  ORF Transcript_16827/g.43944 Transcript_16827/m.43944 type:complete len:201 (+) Transcript_16827:1256-1858(+)
MQQSAFPSRRVSTWVVTSPVEAKPVPLSVRVATSPAFSRKTTVQLKAPYAPPPSAEEPKPFGLNTAGAFVTFTPPTPSNRSRAASITSALASCGTVTFSPEPDRPITRSPEIGDNVPCCTVVTLMLTVAPPSVEESVSRVLDRSLTPPAYSRGWLPGVKGSVNVTDHLYALLPSAVRLTSTAPMVESSSSLVFTSSSVEP